MRPPNGQSLVCALACCCTTSAAGAGAGASGAQAPLLLQAEGATDDNAAAPWPLLQKGMHFLGKSFEGTYGERTQLVRPAAHTLHRSCAAPPFCCPELCISLIR